MCRHPLSIVFPTFFASRTGTRGTTADFSHVGSGKNEWIPPTNKSQDVQMAFIDISTTDHNSEEYIIKKGESEVQNEKDSGIRKVTNFTVKYGS
jgi:hypothetical protein